MERYQTDAVSKMTSNVGYLASTIAIISHTLGPRAKFMKIMSFNLLSTCIAASLSCLCLYCSVKAREHTTPPDASLDVAAGYNSSACVVSALWLMFSVWFVLYLLLSPNGECLEAMLTVTGSQIPCDHIGKRSSKIPRLHSPYSWVSP